MHNYKQQMEKCSDKAKRGGWGKVTLVVDVFRLDVNQPYSPWCFRFQHWLFGSSAGHDEGVTPGAHGAPGPTRHLRLAAVPHHAGLCCSHLGRSFSPGEGTKVMGWTYGRNECLPRRRFRGPLGSVKGQFQKGHGQSFLQATEVSPSDPVSALLPHSSLPDGWQPLATAADPLGYPARFAWDPR